MEGVLGIDLGTSAVKVTLINKSLAVLDEVSVEYPIYTNHLGHSEQHPEDWFQGTVRALRDITYRNPNIIIKGISFSGQMHGLVLLNKEGEVIRPAILWNDTRTTEQCEWIEAKLGKEQLIAITDNVALEGFTLPKLLWVQQYEPSNFENMAYFLLPKDYVRYRLTGEIAMEFSDAAGTLLLNVRQKEWSQEICSIFNIPMSCCPPLKEATDFSGYIAEELLRELKINTSIRVFMGGADNACGAIGATLLKEDELMCSIGSSGVLVALEKGNQAFYNGSVHFFNHAIPNYYYSMAVTLSAGFSFKWWKQNFLQHKTYEQIFQEVEQVPVGAQGLLFTPYLVGERMPYTDSQIRASFIGIDALHTEAHFSRAVIEGIVFSLKDCLQIFIENGKVINRIIAIGGGAKSALWLQIQANIFNKEVVILQFEQGSSMGAAIIAACGVGWYKHVFEAMEKVHYVKESFLPEENIVKQYESLYAIYKQLYAQTREVTKQLNAFVKIHS